MGDGNFADDYEAVFEMMKTHSVPVPAPTPSPEARACPNRPSGEDAALKRRCVEASASASTTEPIGVDGAGGSAGSSLVARPREKGDDPDLPDRVALAYALLELPLNASAADIDRQGRRLARRAHPDKVAPDFPELRKKAEDQFRNLQEAKATALAWLYGQVNGKDWDLGSMGSDSDLGDESSVAESDDAEEKMEIKACNVPTQIGEWEEHDNSPRRRLAPDSGDEDSDAERAAGQAAGGSGLKVADATVVAIATSDNVVEQAIALGKHLESSRAGVAARKKPVCSECFEREAVATDPDGICRACRQDMDRLWKSLGNRVAR